MVNRFDRGERIRVVTYTGFTANACHQEVKLDFEQAVSKHDSFDGSFCL